MVETKHTPLQWVIRSGDNEVEILGAYGSNKVVAWLTPNSSVTHSENKANAELICKAVNSHHLLIDALGDIISKCQHIPKEVFTEVGKDNFQLSLNKSVAILQSLKD